MQQFLIALCLLMLPVDQTYVEANHSAIGQILSIRDELEYLNKKQINPYDSSTTCDYNIDTSDLYKVTINQTKCWANGMDFIKKVFFFNKNKELYHSIYYDSLVINGELRHVGKSHYSFSEKGGWSGFKDSILVTIRSFTRSSTGTFEPSPQPAIYGRFRYRPVVHKDSVDFYRDPVMIFSSY